VEANLWLAGLETQDTIAWLAGASLLGKTTLKARAKKKALFFDFSARPQAAL